MYLSAHQATKKLGVSSDTLRRWLRQGKIAKTSPSGTRLYDISFFPELTRQNATTTSTGPKSGYVYARVSSNKQREDLERQKQLLLSRFPVHKLLSDIGSGVNFKRPGLKTLLEHSSRGLVSEIVVTHRDRLCCFAFDLLQHIFSLHSTKLVVLFNDETSDEHEFSQDILAINAVFICRMQGRRAARYRRERRNQKAQTKDNSSPQQTPEDGKYHQLGVIDQDISKSSSKTDSQVMDGLGEICLQCSCPLESFSSMLYQELSYRANSKNVAKDSID
jgi:putative resolvase